MSRPAWIEVVPEEEATGLLKELYEQELDAQHGVVDNIFKVHSLHPETLRAHADLYHTVMHTRTRDGLTRAECEMIGVVVSAINQRRFRPLERRPPRSYLKGIGPNPDKPEPKEI